MFLKSIPVLLYHRIADATSSSDPLRLGVLPDIFEKQMQYMKKRGFTCVSLDEIVLNKKNGNSFPKKPFAITFDDGYMDNYQNAFPILKKFGFSATIFIVTEFIGKYNSWETTEAIPMLGWGQALEMKRHGFSFGSHTNTHPDLTTLPEEVVLEELLVSRNRIREMLGVAPRHIAYPYGRFTPRIVRLAEKAGYDAAWSAGLSEDGPFSRERFQIASRDRNVRFALKSSGWGSLLRKTFRQEVTGRMLISV